MTKAIMGRNNELKDKDAWVIASNITIGAII